MTRTPLDLVFVASIGRSGSTLLESMLGAHTQMATTGEFHIWPHEIGQNVRRCGCGEWVDDCPFWTAVRRRVDPMAQEGPGLAYFREFHNHGYTLRLERMGDFRAVPTEDLKDRALIQRYGENNYDLFAAFLDECEVQQGERPRFVIDASKDPYRLLWLYRSGLFNIKVVHLVKDPRAFVYSVTKQFIHGENGGPPRSKPVQYYYAARQSTAWTIQNYLFSEIARHVMRPEDYLLVQYEQLATDPHGTFEQVCTMIGAPYEAEAVTNFRRGSVHTIAGNPMRYESRGISLDEKWKTKLPASNRLVARLITGPTEHRYGY